MITSSELRRTINILKRLTERAFFLIVPSITLYLFRFFIQLSLFRLVLPRLTFDNWQVIIRVGMLNVLALVFLASICEGFFPAVYRRIADVEPCFFLDFHTKKQLLHIEVILALLGFVCFSTIHMQYGPAFVVVLCVGVDHAEDLIVLSQYQITLPLL